MINQNSKKLINISKKAFIQVTILLLVLLVITIVLTYIIPAGSFGTFPDGSVDYSSYHVLEGARGIPIWKGLLAPFLVFASSDGLTLITLSLFLLILTAAFQIMNDVGGIHVLIGSVARRFQNRGFLLLSVISLAFMCFGAFLGLFEEMLTMLPIMVMFCLTIGFDSFTGFLISIVACGFGFASAITNPFTVLLASEIIGANPMNKIWYRLIIFVVMYLLLEVFLYIYIRKIRKNPENSFTYTHDMRIREENAGSSAMDYSAANSKRMKWIYGSFLLVGLLLIVLCSLIPSISGYTVVVLTVYFLIFGILAGVFSTGSWKGIFKSFLKGITGALPSIVFIALSASVKYVFEEGHILPTIAFQINKIAASKNIFLIAIVLYGIILLLEFFISSSTAKAVLVMSILAVVNLGLSKQMSVLIYTFADGYTNLLFPTSPVLLISLSIIEMDYLKWVRKSIPLFLVNLLLVIGFLALGIVIGY
ncbi:MAG: hypothetical protein IKF90_21695 [Parasporobacterium sp.]|nr:hypothetical protein [Parasporobacterium sp.]